MDKSEKVLGVGYLKKSPARNRDKANFRGFWMRRLCVFSELTYFGVSGKDTKLVLNYFEDDDSYKRDQRYKGQLNISDCISIKSQFKSQAGFSHIFTIDCQDGQFVKFSASSCEIKFKWIALLRKYKFRDGPLFGERSSEYGILNWNRPSRTRSVDSYEAKQDREESISLDSNNSSICSDKEADSLLRELTERRDSGTFSCSTISSSGSTLEKASSLPSPRPQNQEWKACLVETNEDQALDNCQRCDSGTFSIATDSINQNTTNNAPALPPRRISSEFRPSFDENEAQRAQDERDDSRPAGPKTFPIIANARDETQTKLCDRAKTEENETVNENSDDTGKARLFMFCEACQKSPKRKDSGIFRRISIKKKASPHDEMIEVQRNENEVFTREPSIPDIERIMQDNLSTDDSCSIGEQSTTYTYSKIDEKFLEEVREISKRQDDEECKMYEEDDFDTYVQMNLFTPILSESEYFDKENKDAKDKKDKSKKLADRVEKLLISEDISTNDAFPHDKEIINENGAKENLIKEHLNIRVKDKKVIFSMDL